jgi:hypothetical protein
VKRAELEKLKAVSLEQRMKGAATPDRFGREAAAPAGRREQRERERALGLVPFAVKLDGELVKRLQRLAHERRQNLNELVGELLKKGLGE